MNNVKSPDFERELARAFTALCELDVASPQYADVLEKVGQLNYLRRELRDDDDGALPAAEVPDTPPETPDEGPDAAADENGEPTTTYTQEEVRAALFEAKTKNDIDTGALIHKYAKNLKVLDEKFYGALMADLQTALEAK